MKGRARGHRDIAFAHRARNDPCDRCGQGGACFPGACGPGGSSARWLGAEVARRLTSPVAEASDAGVRDMARSGRQTQPGRLFIAKTKAAAGFRPWNYRGTKVINKKQTSTGCVYLGMAGSVSSVRMRSLLKEYVAGGFFCLVCCVWYDNNGEIGDEHPQTRIFPSSGTWALV